jgi:hypothetical protein
MPFSSKISDHINQTTSRVLITRFIFAETLRRTDKRRESHST